VAATLTSLASLCIVMTFEIIDHYENQEFRASKTKQKKNNNNVRRKLDDRIKINKLTVGDCGLAHLGAVTSSDLTFID